MTTSAFRKHLSQFHGCGQGGFTDRKEDLADEIRGYVRKHFPSQELKTLERLSLRDLTVLRLALNRPGIGT